MTAKLIGAALVAAVATAACTSKSRHGAGSDVAVQVWPGLAVASLAEVPNEWNAGWTNGTFFLKDDKLPGRHHRSLTNCAGLAGVGEDDVLLGADWQRYVLREKLIRCAVLDALLRARPARASYLREVIQADDPGALLPATVSPVQGAPGAASSWRATDPTLTFDRAGSRAGYQELIVGGAFRGRLSWWAAGDFDGDGIEDAVLFSNLSPTAVKDAPNMMRGFLVTRRQASGPVTVIKEFP